MDGSDSTGLTSIDRQGVARRRTIENFATDRALLRQSGLFLVVGLVNTAVGYCLYAGLYLAGLAPWMAVLFGTLIGVIFNFFTTGGIVFKAAAPRTFPKFGLAYVGIYFANVFGLRTLIHHGVGPLAAEAMVLCIVVPCSFFAFKFLVFAPVRKRASA